MGIKAERLGGRDVEDELEFLSILLSGDAGQ
jgi:hypothetical protein